MMYPRPEATRTKGTADVCVKAGNNVVGAQASDLQSLHLRNQGNQDVSSLLLRQVQKMERLFAGHHSRIRHRKPDVLRDWTMSGNAFPNRSPNLPPKPKRNENVAECSPRSVLHPFIAHRLPAKNQIPFLSRSGSLTSGAI